LNIPSPPSSRKMRRSAAASELEYYSTQILGLPPLESWDS
jgi:hypothetical protein